MRLIDADGFVTMELYDDEKEEYYTERMTIAEALDRYTEEGCPSSDRPKGKWVDSDGEQMRIGQFSGYCSKCGVWSEWLTEFCGRCGTEMEGADDGDQ